MTLALVAVASIELLAARVSPGPAQANRLAVGSGALVYLARSGSGKATLWVIDLLAGVARRGPVVPATTRDLIDVSGAGPGWIGIEHRATHRRIAVSVVRGIAADAEVVRLGRGDLVAWGPGGASLVFARNGSRARAGCAPVRISLVAVVTEKESWALDDPGFCGPVLSLSRSAAATYFTAASGDRLSVYLTGSVGVPHLTFEGVSMVSASPPSAFLLARRTAGATPGTGSTPRTLLGWKGVGGPVTVGDGEHVLAVDRVLAWSTDAGRAALVGSLGARAGVFVVDAGSGPSPRVPRFVMPVGPGADATFDGSGRLYLSADGGLFVAQGSSLDTVPLPEGAPPPAGPIVWIP